MKITTILKKLYKISSVVIKVIFAIYVIHVIHMNVDVSLKTLNILSAILKQNDDVLFAMLPAAES
jgi:hypothetical protein